MELNVKNCLGPSHEDIPTTLMLHRDWYADHVLVVDDADFGYTPPNYKGPQFVYHEDIPGEAEWVERRMNQLEELMSLRDPVHPFMEACGGNLCKGNQADFDAYEAYCNGEEF